MKYCVVLGTRPEIIKLAPVIRELERRELQFILIHTGQHYSYEMDEAFFWKLCLPEPAYDLEVGSGTHAEQTGQMLMKLEAILAREKPHVVIVQGDTNSTLAGGLAAAKLNIPVAHVEAGLRSFDNTMPEEINRRLVDHLSRYLFAPTTRAVEHLAREGIVQGVHLTGNTVMDTITYLKARFREEKFLAQAGLERKGYIFLTLHRQENTDSRERLGQIIEGLRLVALDTGLPLVCSLHPRTYARLKLHGLYDEFTSIPRLRVIYPPVGIMEALEFQAYSRLVMTDSGGLQEESCILGAACVTIRENTERPETVDIGANILAGYHPESIRECCRRMLAAEPNWDNPYGDGTSGKKTVDILEAGA